MCLQQAYTGRPAADPWQADFHATPSLNLTWAMPLFALLVFASSKAYFSIRRQVRERARGFGLALAAAVIVANLGVWMDSWHAFSMICSWSSIFCFSAHKIDKATHQLDTTFVHMAYVQHAVMHGDSMQFHASVSIGCVT